MRIMGIEAIYPKPRLSIAGSDYQKYPYLLKDLDINRPDQAWASDITYIRMRQGFIYLVAVMDWFSRFVLAWEISVSLDKEFCISCLKAALAVSVPGIFNTDQGSQFTSNEFTQLLTGRGVAISMDGRGRVFDNIFVERLWRSVKYEEVFLHDYQSVREAGMCLRRYIKFYNEERVHQALNYRVPAEVYHTKRPRE